MSIDTSIPSLFLLLAIETTDAATSLEVPTLGSNYCEVLVKLQTFRYLPIFWLVQKQIDSVLPPTF